MFALLLLASWLPLETGNQWTYRVDSRTASNQYVTVKVTGERDVAGVLYFVLAEGAAERLLREDDRGRIWEHTESGERLWLDPSPYSSSSAAIVIETRGLKDTVPAGTFDGVAEARIQQSTMLRRTLRFAPGVGILRDSTTLIAGSSGGFLESRTLVYARTGRRAYTAPEFTISLGVEHTAVRLEPGAVTNCAVPCYFVACGLVPGADPPGTFKPCMRVRLSLHNSGPLIPSAGVEWTLRDHAGGIAHQSRQSLDAIDSGETTIARPLPLYTSMPLAAGDYVLTVTVEPGRWASVPITILP